jgi:tetratricopeptide (TPR) repeat protein
MQEPNLGLKALGQMLWSYSDDFFHRGEFEEAAKVDEIVGILDPHFTEAHTTAAWLYGSAGKPDLEMALYKRAIEMNPFDPQGYFDIAMAYHYRQQHNMALPYFEEMAEWDPPQQYLRMLAHTYEKLDKFEESLKVWDRVLRMMPNDPVAKSNRDRVAEKAQK